MFYNGIHLKLNQLSLLGSHYQRIITNYTCKFVVFSNFCDVRVIIVINSNSHRICLYDVTIVPISLQYY